MLMDHTLRFVSRMNIFQVVVWFQKIQDFDPERPKRPLFSPFPLDFAAFSAGTFEDAPAKQPGLQRLKNQCLFLWRSEGSKRDLKSEFETIPNVSIGEVSGWVCVLWRFYHPCVFTFFSRLPVYKIRFLTVLPLCLYWVKFQVPKFQSVSNHWWSKVLSRRCVVLSVSSHPSDQRKPQRSRLYVLSMVSSSACISPWEPAISCVKVCFWYRASSSIAT